MIRPPRVPRALFEWLTLWRSIAVIGVVGGGYAWLVVRASRHGEVALSVATGLAPIVAFLVAPAIIGLLSGYFGWVRERTWEPWHGRYYAFDDHQIRIVEARGRLWFSSKDVHDALGMPRRDAVLKSMSVSQIRDDDEVGEMVSNEGLVRLLGRSTERRALRLLNWADGEIRRPWQKQRDRLDRVFDPEPPAATAKASPDDLARDRMST